MNTRKVLALGLFVSLSTPAMADDGNRFIGLGFSTDPTLDYDSNPLPTDAFWFLPESSQRPASGATTITFGWQTEPSRSYAAVTLVSFDDSSDSLTIVSANHDRFFGWPQLHGFFGGNLGYAMYHNSFLAGDVTASDDNNGITYGLQGGVIWQMVDTLQLEVGYRYRLFHNSGDIGLFAYRMAYAGVNLTF